MTDILDQPLDYTSARFNKAMTRRRSREGWLKALGILAIAGAIGMLFVLFATIVMQAHTAFLQTRIGIPFDFEASLFDGVDRKTLDGLDQVNFRAIMQQGLYDALGKPDSRAARREMNRLLSTAAAFRLREAVRDDPGLIGRHAVVWLPASSDVDITMKGVVARDIPSGERMVSDDQLAWLDTLEQAGRLEIVFNIDFFERSDSREPEAAGIFGAVIGSALMLAVTIVVVLPLGLATAVYLEEFAPRNRWTELIDVNIRNLAAVPSIVFGLLGLAVFIRLMGVPRSTPVAGGLVLALMTLPTIIIAARAAIQAVPPSLREAALQLGASRMQATVLAVLPNALPGILTGTIIGMAEALGETAPLLMIGMVAFIASSPAGFTDPAAPLPVQIYLWSTSPERGFVEKTAAAIVILLLFLLVMNAVAIYLRIRSQKKW
jgi:phosphate transport system permease protein